MKFTSFDKNVSHVASLPDTPTLENGYTSTALKQTFDRAGEEIKEYINETLLFELEGEGASVKIGCSPIETVEGTNVQTVLENISRQVQDISNASIPEGTVTPDKFIPSVSAFITEGSLRACLFDTNGTYTFVPTRTGNYKITVQGAGGGGGVGGTWLVPLGGCSGACTIGYTRLVAGKEYTLVVGRGGQGLLKSDDGTLISKAEKGTASGFYDNGTELFFAEGGDAGCNNPDIAESRGGIICMRGDRYVASLVNNNHDLEFAIGASSYFGKGALCESTGAQTGAGGYGSEYSYSIYIYTRNGTAGGDGAILIEWVE